MGYRIGDEAIELSYKVRDDEGQTEDVRITVPLRFRPCRYGGHRAYLGCPYCLRTCEVIVMTTSGRQWGCRRCLRLRYQSLTPAERSLACVFLRRYVIWCAKARRFDRLRDAVDLLIEVTGDKR